MTAALKLYTGSVDTETPATPFVCETVREAYLAHAADEAGISASTAKTYRQALDAWERLTANPELAALRQADVSAFRADLAAGGPATTANKHLRALRTILNRIGPPTARYPDAAGILDKVPFVKLLPEVDPVPTHFTDDELCAIHNAAKWMKWPRIYHMKPANWWRGLLVLGVTYGPRIGDLMGLSWNNVECEAENRQRTTDNCPESWISFRAQKTAKLHRWPVNAAVSNCLEDLIYYAPTRNPDPENRILPCPENPSKLYASFRHLCELANVHRSEPLSFHALRSTAAKRYDEFQRGLGAVILGHAVPVTVTTKHYLGDAALADAYRAIRTIQQPEAFLGNA